ncbi:16S rRNA (uracil(1498)-N(3))-methyltransferase [Psychrobacter arenosus]|uniref:16S rRNA (uracil(1498)-N(3))-methyltransferase n=1 Tax=Psychrobacter arenosus TaxID=256326 RepID=UPI00191974CA
MRRFYYDVTAASKKDQQPSSRPLATYTENDEVPLPESVVHHWCRVLRAAIGDKAVLFDGHGGEYVVELTEVSKKHASVQLLDFAPVERTPTILTTIGLVMSRGDRMDYAIQKATELGVTDIQLLTSQHGEVNLKADQVAKKLLHWQQVAISACEQCGLNRPPIILAPQSVADWLTIGLEQTTQGIHSEQVNAMMVPLLSQPFYRQLTAPSSLRLLLAVPRETAALSVTERIAQVCQSARASITHLENPSVDSPAPIHMHLLIGPEGGLSASEEQLALDNDFIAWQIGARILRTETAPVVALATLHALTTTDLAGSQ